MWASFFLENARFTINLFAALVFFAVGWLYFDAWLERRERKEQIRYIGYFILSLSFLVAGTQVESTLISSPLPQFLTKSIEIVSILGRIVGYMLIIRSLMLDPIQPHPDISKFAKAIVLPTFMRFSILPFVSFLFPLGSAYIALLYLKRATIGYENHI